MTLKLKGLMALSVLFLLCSCEVQLEDNMRIVVKGQVQDQYQAAIPEAKITVQTRRGNYSGSQSSYVLGEGYSTADGQFSVISFYDGDEDFAIEVSAGDDYSSYVYKQNTVNFTPSDYTFNLETVALKAMADFNLKVLRTSGEGNTLTYSLTYTEGFCLEFYEGEQPNPYDNTCYPQRMVSQQLNDNGPDIEKTYRVPIGEPVVFTYSINDEPEITEIITVNTASYDFSFSY
ncbi:MAG: hypothetical protein ABJQ39_12485 [Winogradskyella arenosi]